jgi:hypothetical protein
MVEDQYAPDAILHKYEWFKNQYNSIQQIGIRTEQSRLAIENYKQMMGDPSKWNFSQHEEFSRLSTIYSGYQSQYNALAAEYNSQSSKFNWDFARTNELPRRVELK